MDKITFTKLSNLVDKDFTITKAGGYQFKKWDNEARRMLVEEKYTEGYRKLYTIDTDKGRMDLGAGQLGNLLEGVYKNGVADINGVTFHVKSNGKSGMDIRYFFNVVKENSQSGYDKAKEIANNLKDDYEPNTIDLDSIPF
jgi:hypothetical protein